MNLNQFKVVGEDNVNLHIAHPSGKKLLVRKADLSDKAKGIIQRFADGGGVDAEVPLASEGTPPPAPVPQALAAPVDPAQAQPGPDSSLGLVPNYASDPSLAPAPDQAAAPQPDVSAPVPMPSQPVDVNATLEQRKKILMDGLGDQGRSNQVAGQAFDDYNQGMKNVESPLEIAAKYKFKDDDLMNQYKNATLDPNRFMKNQSTGSKVLAGIGLILSGAGSATTGQPNLAMQQINRAIDNDIEAQKNDQSRIGNLWKMNHEQMGSEMQANLATQNQMLTGVKVKLDQAAQLSAYPLAKERALLGINDIDMQMAQNRQRLALMQGGAAGADPVTLVPQLVPKEHQAAALKELAQAQAASKNQDQMMKLFDQARSENTVMRTGGGMLRTPASMLTLQALGDPLIHDQDGRVNEFEKKDFNNLLPQPGDTDAKIAQKRQGLQMFINNKKAAPTAKAFGINPENFQSTTSSPAARLTGQDRQYYEWAKANPSNPKAQMVMKKLGL